MALLLCFPLQENGFHVVSQLFSKFNLVLRQWHWHGMQISCSAVSVTGDKTGEKPEESGPTAMSDKVFYPPSLTTAFYILTPKPGLIIMCFKLYKLFFKSKFHGIVVY